jgi:radical SAM enzyme (TIGR01210 family)
MDDLRNIISKIRKRNIKPNNPREYISSWVEKDVLEEEVVDAFVMILRTSGCSWASDCGCSMCGYTNDAVINKVEDFDLLHQFDSVMQNYSNEKIVKVFTSGSFFDESEISNTMQDKILKNLSEKTQKIIIESRPEFIRSERLAGKKKLEIALGLESANDFVLRNSINKGFGFKDYEKAVKIILDNNLKIKTYLLIKPPFLTEKEAISDAVDSAQKIVKYTQTISFNPVNIQKFTLVERLWRNGEYRPPWLWSVVAILKQSSKLKGIRFMSSPTAGGTKRGAHNCGACDKEILKNIEEFSHTQNPSYLEDIDCDCRNLWKDILNTGSIAKAQGDLSKLV